MRDAAQSQPVALMWAIRQLGLLCCAGVVIILAQTPAFRLAGETAVAEAMQRAFKLVAADVTGDGRPDLLVTSSGGVVLLVNGGERRFEIGKQIPVPADWGPSNLAVADFDRDAFPDLAVYCFETGLLSIHHGDGAGAFELRFMAAMKDKATEARGLLAADLNQDGAIDLAIGQPGNVSVLAGNGDGTFRDAQELPIRGAYQGGRPAAIVSADFDGDGAADLATVNLVYNDEVSVFPGNGGGKFGEERKVSPGCRPYDLAAVDANQDGRLDLAVACDSGLVLLEGKGDGTFVAGLRVRSEDRSMSVAAADLNGDGKTDFVLGNYYGGTISVTLSQGDGSFRTVDPVRSIGDVFSVALTDLDGDRATDLAAASYSGSSALFAAGRGDGGFDLPIYFGTSPANTFPLKVADFDADGKSDLAVVAEGRRSILLLRRGTEVRSVVSRNDYPVDAQFGDFNRDGIRDLALVTVKRYTGRLETDFGSSIKVLPGRAEGGFGPEISTALEQCAERTCAGFPSARNILKLAAGDFTGDGTEDLALLDAPLRKLLVYAGNGDGSFGLVETIEADAQALVSGDFDGDGVGDIAVRGWGSVVVYAGSAGDRLRNAGTYEICAMAMPGASIQTADFNGDKKPDLAAYCGGEVDVLLNGASGKFQPVVQTMVRAQLSPVSVGDFDGDGKDDLVAVFPPGLVLLVSSGDGGFRTPVEVALRLSPVAMVAARFDDDNKADLAVLDGLDGKLKILVRELESQAPAFIR